MSEQSATATTVTVDDPRVAELASFTGLPATEVLDHVTEDAATDSQSVSDELDGDVAVVELLGSMGSMDEDDEDDEDDEYEDEDL